MWIDWDSRRAFISGCTKYSDSGSSSWCNIQKSHTSCTSRINFRISGYTTYRNTSTRGTRPRICGSCICTSCVCGSCIRTSCVCRTRARRWKSISFWSKYDRISEFESFLQISCPSREYVVRSDRSSRAILRKKRWVIRRLCRGLSTSAPWDIGILFLIQSECPVPLRRIILLQCEDISGTIDIIGFCSDRL